MLVGVTSEPDDTCCPTCGSHPDRKLVSRVAKFRSEDGRIDEIADQLEVMGEPDSPTQMRQMMKEMGKAMDEDMGDEIEEMFEADMEGNLEDDDL